MIHKCNKKESLVLFFPYSMGKDFLSGGVTKILIANLQKKITLKWEVHLIVPLDNEGLVKYIERYCPNVEIHQIDFTFPCRFKDEKYFWERIKLIYKNGIKCINSSKNVKKILYSLRPKIVHFQTVASFVYLKYAKKLGAKVILHAHVYRIADNKILLKIILYHCKKNVDLILTPTKDIKKLFQNKISTQVIKNPIVETYKTKNNIINKRYKSKENYLFNTVNNYKSGNKCVNFVFVGRINRVKQIHYFLEAMVKLDKMMIKKIMLWIIGKPNNEVDKLYKDELENYVDRYRLQNVVSFIGYVDNVGDYLKTMNVGILLSKSEALPMAGIEYMINRLPVIAFNNPGLRELIIDKYSGFLVKNNNLNELAKIIEFCVLNPDELNKMGNNARRLAKKEYNINKYTETLLEIYDKLLNSE